MTRTASVSAWLDTAVSRPSAIAVALVGWMCLGIVGSPAAEDRAPGAFQPDVHTLFLSHFDDQIHEADYALGIGRFCGNGAGRIEGYFGGGLDLRPRGLSPDFIRTCEDFTPRFDGWGFRARGNVDPAQGTLECWFQLDDPKRPRATWSGGTLLSADLQRCVPHPDKSKDSYASFNVSVSTYALRYILPTVAGGCFTGEVLFKSVPGYARALDPLCWHHIALTWSQGEMVLWLDGRGVVSFDMTGQLGLVLLDNPTRYVSMSNCLLDELRISNVVRYSEAFEPGWRDGQRPAYAFSGTPELNRHAPRLLPAPVAKLYPLPSEADRDYVRCPALSDLEFDRRNGALFASVSPYKSAEGLHLYRGLERQRLQPLGVKDYRGMDASFNRGLCFTQQFEGQVEAVHRIARGASSSDWQVTLVNRGTKEVWLEVLLGLPLAREVTEVFDGCEVRRAVSLPRHRDEYCLTLPFVAASSDREFLGVGIDPHVDLSDIVTEWVPMATGGVVRVGTKLALSPGESFSLPFVVVDSSVDRRTEFGTLDAVPAFHACFPDLYRLRPDVPVYSYMPATQDVSVDNAFDFKRLGYAGGFWGHGPGHDKGDEFGRPEWWDNPQFYNQREYQGYTRRIERLWQSLAALREIITYHYRQSYDNGYPVRRFHTCPDLTPQYIVQSLWPGYEPNEDPLCFGQYYRPITNWFIVNEHNTPIGAFFRETTRNYFRQTAGCCPGFINDMSHAGALYRHNDPIAQKTPGRSFSRDLGTFVRKALGRKQRYEVLNQFVDEGHRASFWSDGGSFSYTLCAYSAAIAIEGADMYRDLSGTATYVIPARNLLGEKPLTAMTHMNDDFIGTYLRPDEFTPESLRDYYRFCDSQLTLFCLRYGVTLDPSSYMWGRQVSVQRAPLMVESTVLGRKVVPAARVNPPLWVCRAGEGLQTLLIVGNDKPTRQTLDLRIANRYFPAAPIVAPYYGGKTQIAVTREKTTLAPVNVEPRDVQAFKTVALLESQSPARVTCRWEGDGLSMQIILDITAKAGADVWLSDFAPLYAIESLKIDGQPALWRPGESLTLDKDSVRIEYTCRNRALAFAAEQWNAVELMKDGAVNFCLIADPGTEYVVPTGNTSRSFAVGYERGTAAMLNQFVEQYDSEDGVPDNLAPSPIAAQRPEGFDGWAVRFVETAGLAAGRVRIETDAREIVVEGPTQGEIRRAMVVLMRLVDRKYPHVGRFFPLRKGGGRYHPGKPLPLDKWVDRKPTRQFYEQFTDALFLAKPVLTAEYEPLYAQGNMDFAGRYRMPESPYLFEPTFGDRFVYGYSGPGKAESREELHRGIAPVESQQSQR